MWDAATTFNLAGALNDPLSPHDRFHRLRRAGLGS